MRLFICMYNSTKRESYVGSSTDDWVNDSAASASRDDT